MANMYDEIIEYKNNVEACSKLFLKLSVMNAQQEELYNELIPRMAKLYDSSAVNIVKVSSEDKAVFSETLGALRTQQGIDATVSAACMHSAIELNRLAKKLDIKE